MDSLTHIALGACMGELFAGRQLGKKAMLWGALAQSIPDIDFVAAFWMDTPAALLAHRGFTHSVLFVGCISLLLAFLAERFHRPHNISLLHWYYFFAAAAGIHIFIDAFNNYGVGWWEPFNHQRISFNAIYVVDPLFSVIPGIACIVLLFWKQTTPKRNRWSRIGLVMPAVYLLYCLCNKSIVQAGFLQSLKKQAIPHRYYFSTPAPLQSSLWYVVSGDEQGYYAGYRSVFDHTDTMQWQYFPVHKERLISVQDQHAVQQLVRFSKGFYTVDSTAEGVVFNDLRFGQSAGWIDPLSPFAFHYFFGKNADNRLVVQRGRFYHWDEQVIKALWQRIKGH